MVYIICSACQAVILSCGHNVNISLGFVSCGACQTAGGRFSDFVKQQYNLVDKSTIKDLQRTKLQLEEQFSAYKQKYYVERQVIIKTLINEKTQNFAQMYVALKDSIKDREPKLAAEADKSAEKVLKQVENSIKRIIITETKILTGSLKEQEETNVLDYTQVKQYRDKQIENLKNMKKMLRQKDKNKDRENLFEVQEINIYIEFFNSKMNKLNQKRSTLEKIIQMGSQIIIEDRQQPVEGKQVGNE